MSSVEPIPVRGLNEYAYCPRLFHLMYVQGIFLESPDTLAGSAQHDRAEARRPKPKARRKNDDPESEDAAETEDESPWPSPPRDLLLGDDELGLTGRLDAVEEVDGHFAPVESKHGPAPDGNWPFVVEEIELAADAWGNDQVQLCGQGLLLGACGYPSSYGYLYYRKTKSRVRVEFSEALRNATFRVISNARRCRESEIPPPLVDSKKCVRCSLVEACLPEEVNFRLGKIEEPRRIIPGRDDLGMVYVVTQGARVGKKGESLSIVSPDEDLGTVPLKDTAGLTVFGNVQVTTQALHMLLESGRQITFASRSGRLIGVAGGLTTKNVSLRREQVRRFDDEESALSLAKSVVVAKIRNQRTLIRRNSSDGDSQTAFVLAALAERTEAASATDSIASLRGEEGLAARFYFERFPALLKDETLRAQMKGRSKRPPKDPVNAMLSYGYTLLTRDFTAACAAAGLDPMIGFYHAMEAGRPALVLDLMEPFRPLVVDSLVLRLVNTGAIAARDFVVSTVNAVMTDSGRRAFLAGYEQRVDEMVTHPEFGYRLSYRRIFELEARLVARFLSRELEDYRPLTTR